MDGLLNHDDSLLAVKEQTGQDWCCDASVPGIGREVLQCGSESTTNCLVAIDPIFDSDRVGAARQITNQYITSALRLS